MGGHVPFQASELTVLTGHQMEMRGELSLRSTEARDKAVAVFCRAVIVE